MGSVVDDICSVPLFFSSTHNNSAHSSSCQNTYIQHIKIGSINPFHRLFVFISSKLLNKRRAQREHCDQLTDSKLPKL